MSADLLRRAAKVLRQHAEATTPDWRHEAGRIRTPEIPHLIKVRGTDPALAIYRRNQDAEYSVLMHPPVALALADLLDLKADTAGVWPGDMTVTDRAALAVARAILREPEATT